jgi:serine/threonine protein kinase
LEALHQQGYLNLSITADNILIENSGYVKLYGFKSCRKKSFLSLKLLSNFKNILRKEDGYFETCSLNEQYLNGDISIYTAPEILIRKSPNQASDYYSVGVILYQMMIGRVL